ncbi:MAG: hypothetical protein V4683_18240 [Bacteroidota bacterium]
MVNSGKIVLLFSILLLSNLIKAQLGISAADGFIPDPKAMLDVSSTTKGLLIPRMNTIQRTGIVSPPISLMVFDTDVKSYWYFNGAEWKELGAGGGTSINAWNLLGNLAVDEATNFIGTSDGINLNFRTGNLQRMQIAKTGQIGIGANYLSNSKLYVSSKIDEGGGLNENGILSEIRLPFNPANPDFTLISSAVKGINSSEINGKKYGGYFESNSTNPLLGNNIGVSAIAKNGYDGNIGLYAASGNNNLSSWAAHFANGHVKIDNTLSINTTPSAGSMLEATKIDTKNGAYFNMPSIGKNNWLYIGKVNLMNKDDFIGLEINTESTPSQRALEVHGRSTFYDKVGINTTTVPAAYSLAVNGFIIAEELRIQNSTLWPDYVFEKNYNLKSLTEVANFIEKNKHLPDVPSAKIVENEGIILGEMQKTLLKKIEELTLYIIDQQKQIDTLKASVETLKNK